MINLLNDHLTKSAMEGVRRTVFDENNKQDVVENTIDAFFDPLIDLGSKIDNFFGW